MASAFLVGDKFRNRVAELLEKTDSSLPQGLREELEVILEKTEPTTLPFSTARKFKKHLQDEGDDKSFICLTCSVTNGAEQVMWSYYSNMIN